jgi:predicted RND superfamily exporter protein
MSSPSSEEAPEGTGLALGIERIGLVSLRYPIVAAIVAVLVLVVAALGVARLRVDDSLSQLFRSDTDEFRQYEEVSARFPSAEFDVLVVVEGNVLERDSLQALRDLVTDLQLVEGTRGLISLFSARQPPAYSGGLPEPLFPVDLPPEGPEYDAFVAKVMDNELIKGKLLSLDGTLALVVLALDPEIVGGRGLSTVVAEIRDTVDFDLTGSGVSGRLSGVPVMQLEIRNAVERDRLIYNAVGFIAGCLIAGLFFRRLSFIVIAAGPPLIAIVWSLGALGWFDFRLNMFLNVMIPLIMVMGFSDSMQVTFAARDRLLAGDTKYEAFKSALLVVGPAVVVTDLTAALSFIALMFSKSELIRTFGYAGAISCVIAFLAVIILVPLFGMLLVRNEQSFAAKVKGSDTSIDFLRAVCTWIANTMVKRPGLYSLLALIVVGGLAFMFANLEPRYRLADQVPDKEEAVAASGSIDVKLAGANPIDVLVELPAGKSIFDPDSLEAIAAIHTAVETQKGVANVWSVETLRRWLIERMGRTDPGAVEEYVNLLPADIVRRFVSAEEDAVVIAGRIPDVDASQLLPVVEELDASLDTVRQAHPDYNIAVTGLSAIAARNSALMIDQLAESLTWEMIAVAALIGIAFRSVLVMVVAILPGLFPIVVAGAILWYLDAGLQFASIVALTVAFGLGLDATIHFLNRLRLEYRPDEDPGEGVKRATVLVGPALILTSLVLACGLAVTVFSDLPSLQLFGWLSAFTLVAALVGDLLILPATVTFLRRMVRAIRGNRPAASAKPPA